MNLGRFLSRLGKAGFRLKQTGSRRKGDKNVHVNA